MYKEVDIISWWWYPIVLDQFSKKKKKSLQELHIIHWNQSYSTECMCWKRMLDFIYVVKYASKHVYTICFCFCSYSKAL